MVKIKIEKLEKEFDLGFDLSVALQYEDQFNEEFDVTKLEKKSIQMKAIYASIASFNDGAPSFKEFSHAISLAEFNTCGNMLAQCILDFYHIPEMAEKHVKNDGSIDNDGDSESPNA